MVTQRAPKQWRLTKNETITSFESWRQNLQYTLSHDANFATYLVDEDTWLKKTSTNPVRGFTDDGEGVAQQLWRTAAQKVTHLELMLVKLLMFAL